MNNEIYCCDNLKLLKRLSNEHIDLIYCDILYGTGHKYKEYEDLKCDREIIEEFYIPRIKQMYRTLKITGSIYIHLDWRISHWIRCLMDDIFEYKNFRNEIVWCYTFPGRDNKNFQKRHDTILRYSKSNDFVFNSNDIRVQYKAKFTAARIPQGAYDYSINEQKERHEKGKVPESWWADISNVSSWRKELTGYSTQKPETLLKRIILASSNKGDLVADFFCGSGTTGVVCKKLDRRYLLCDNSETAIRITKKRLI